MPGSARKDIVREGEIGVYHTWSRCVQRAFLCGVDPETGINYDYRRDWIEKLLAYQTAIFCVEVANYTILSNHQHLICRTRPDLVLDLSDEDVAWRWKMAWPKWNGRDWTREPTDQEIRELLLDPEKIQAIRQALSSLSWFMARVKEPVARLANEESDRRGHYYESRFGSRELVDHVGEVVCSVYLDINQRKAGLAPSLEESNHSAIQQRIRAWRAREIQESLEKFQSLEDSAHYVLPAEVLEDLLADCWLSPIGTGGPLLLVPEKPSLMLPQSLVIPPQPTAAEPAASAPAEQPQPPGEQEPSGDEPAKPAAAGQRQGDRAAAEPSQLRAGEVQPKKVKPKKPGQPSWEIHRRLWKRRRPRPSDHCFLNMSPQEYLQVVQSAVARLSEGAEQMRPDLPAYFQKEQIDPLRWHQAVEQFEQWFGRAVGRTKAIERILQRSGRRWVHGLRRCRATFS